MQGIYGKATVCDYFNKTNCNLFLEPGELRSTSVFVSFDNVVGSFSVMPLINFTEITERFVNSRDPEELKWLWTAWRNASGKQVRSLYPTYVNLSNEAAQLNSESCVSNSIKVPRMLRNITKIVNRFLYRPSVTIAIRCSCRSTAAGLLLYFQLSEVGL